MSKTPTTACTWEASFSDGRKYRYVATSEELARAIAAQLTIKFGLAADSSINYVRRTL